MSDEEASRILWLAMGNRKCSHSGFLVDTAQEAQESEVNERTVDCTGGGNSLNRGTICSDQQQLQGKQMTDFVLTVCVGWVDGTDEVNWL